MGLSVPDSLCAAAPPLRKNRRRGVCGEDATVHRLISDGWSISSSSVKTANYKIPVSSVFNDCEGLYGTTVCRCLVRRLHYSAQQMMMTDSIWSQQEINRLFENFLQSENSSVRKRSATLFETVKRNSMHWGFKCRVAQLGHAPRPSQACVKYVLPTISKRSVTT